MKIELPQLPPLGFGILLNGQQFVFLGLQDHEKQNGDKTKLMRWQSNCVDCGASFESRAPFLQVTGSKRCPDHAAPGRKAPLTIMRGR